MFSNLIEQLYSLEHFLLSSGEMIQKNELEEISNIRLIYPFRYVFGLAHVSELNSPLWGHRHNELQVSQSLGLARKL